MKTPKDIPLGAAQVTPGEILKEEFLEPLGLSQREVARRMKIGPMRLSEIIRGRRSITADTALRLAEVFEGTTPRFWMNLQTNHDLAKAALKMSSAA
jgi:addiction module HigA family antidote